MASITIELPNGYINQSFPAGDSLIISLIDKNNRAFLGIDTGLCKVTWQGTQPLPPPMPKQSGKSLVNLVVRSSPSIGNNRITVMAKDTWAEWDSVQVGSGYKWARLVLPAVHAGRWVALGEQVGNEQFWKLD